MKNKISMAMSLAVILAMLLTSLALADVLNGDALVAQAGTQDVINRVVSGGDTVTYDFGAWIAETGNANDDVFTSGASLTVTITRSGDWLDTPSGAPNSFTFTAYNAQQNGTIAIHVPCDSAAGTIKEMTVNLAAGTSTNGKALDPQRSSVTLRYRIEAGSNGSNCAPTNAAPSVDAGGPYSGSEGSAISLDGTVTDPDGDTLTTAWTYAVVSADAGALCSFASASAVDTTITCNDDGTYTVTLTADDGQGHVVSDNAALTVANANPVIDSVTNSGPIVEGSSAAINITAHDPGTNDSLSYAYDCNNDNVYESSTASCAFADNGTFTVGVQVTDDDGGAATSTTQVIVTNANPVVAAPSWANASVACRTPATLTGISFSDAGVIDFPWTVDINWSDGSTSFTTNTQGAQTNQSHTYNTPGTYSATVSVTDKDGGLGSNTSGPLTVRQTYTVNFLQPFDNSSPSNLVTNTMKSGRTVPVKVTLYDDCAQAYITDPAAAVKIFLSTGNTTGSSNDAVEVYADAGASNSNTLYFRWTSDPAAPGGGFWIYNLDSRTALNGSALAINTTYRVDVFVGTVKATESKWALLKPVK